LVWWGVVEFAATQTIKNPQTMKFVDPKTNQQLSVKTRCYLLASN
jgi:hypothetical protein